MGKGRCCARSFQSLVYTVTKHVFLFPAAMRTHPRHRARLPTSTSVPTCLSFFLYACLPIMSLFDCCLHFYISLSLLIPLPLSLSLCASVPRCLSFCLFIGVSPCLSLPASPFLPLPSLSCLSIFAFLSLLTVVQRPRHQPHSWPSFLLCAAECKGRSTG